MAEPDGDLDGWGADDAVRTHAADARCEVPDGSLGRVVRVERGESDVVTDDGEVRVVSDSLRAQSDLAPVTGDWVLVTDHPDVGPRIERILPRSHTLIRRDPGEEGVEQVLVANVDTVMIVHGLDRPLPPGRLERALVLAWASGAEPVVVLAKADLADPGADETEAIVRAVAPGVPVVRVSATTGSGLAELHRWVRPGTTTALLGESGAGKSTLVNALVGEEVQDTREVRASDAKGRHTTVTRDLLRLPTGGLVVDTPGVRALGLWGGEDALVTVFADIEALSTSCRFSDCTHGQEPGCAVQAAIAAGDLDARRLDRYRAMVAEIAELRRRDEARARRSGGRRRPSPRRRR